ncbi:flavonol synthase flavanone 3-hydroxylase [Pyrenophora seminiperda CCB06]|uniref:Flavonol synthase flavanone 3-hydroxylase n=1 Tax=Pyrenophora seminiperda CCB06 TaxID=1302712 RepID=A0A3M7M0K9_9PLEO|nr:flavonol synthase flavanone 3-hydroxylase [Pyrenophora seminiperda CCB06]
MHKTCLDTIRADRAVIKLAEEVSVGKSDQTKYDETRAGAAAYLQQKMSLAIGPSLRSIPIIDLRRSFSESLADHQAVAAQIRETCTTSGFFYLQSTSYPSQLAMGFCKKWNALCEEKGSLQLTSHMKQHSIVLDLAHLFRLFALSLSLPEDYFDSMTTHPGGNARLIYYPPPRDNSPQIPKLRQEEQIGLGATLGLPMLHPPAHFHYPRASKSSSHPHNGTSLRTYPIPSFGFPYALDKRAIQEHGAHKVVNRSSKTHYSVPHSFFSVQLRYPSSRHYRHVCRIMGEKSKWKPIRAGEYILERLNAKTCVWCGGGGAPEYGMIFLPIRISGETQSGRQIISARFLS